MPDRFASASTETKELPGGDWVEFKSELTYAEEKRLAGGALRQAGVDEDGAPTFRVDLAAYNVDSLATWLVAWSFTRTGADGKRQPVPVSRDAIAALSVEAGEELEALLQAHIQELQAKKAQRAAETTMAPTTNAASGAPK